ncbi:MAG: LCP family protein [Actinomycetota bacterium]|nr:LCP family protein [Actinomycetota bacterium]
MSVYAPDPEGPPRLAWGLWKKFLLGSILIIVFVAAPTATAILLQVKDAVDAFQSVSRPIPGVQSVLDDVKAGQPQTILVLGSDRRFADIKTKAPVRSDTIILVRLDPHKDATAVMSIPRDLKVEIPGFGEDRINAAYADGGPKLTVRTVRDLLAIPINHVVNVNFGGFRRAVNRLGCVYADVDRRYFNDNNPPRDSPTKYATIDLKPGYQKLCGQDALDYVRFRHLDDDFVRAARQQEFLRQAKEQIGVGKLFGDREQLLRIFGRYTDTDIRGEGAILRLLKLAYEASKNPIREVRFRGHQDPHDDFVTIGPTRLDRTTEEFLNVRASPGPRAAAPRARTPKRVRKRRGLARGLVTAKEEGENHVLDMATRLPTLPVYFPKTRLARGGYVKDSPRSYDLFDRNRIKYRAYRIVLSQGDNGQFYGVQGTTWKAPPILDNPTDEVRMRGRTYQRYFDGRKIRLIAFRTRRAVYWVANTLSQRLTNKQMMDIAASLQRIGQ